MLEQDVSSGGKHFMDMMLQKRRNPQAKHAIVCLNCAVVAVAPKERIRKENQMIVKRRQRAGKLPRRYMHLKILKKELKVRNGFFAFSFPFIYCFYDLTFYFLITFIHDFTLWLRRFFLCRN